MGQVLIRNMLWLLLSGAGNPRGCTLRDCGQTSRESSGGHALQIARHPPHRLDL